jgi:hypothetical protein
MVPFITVNVTAITCSEWHGGRRSVLFGKRRFVILAMALALSGCDTISGVSRTAAVHKLPDFDQAEGAYRRLSGS